MNRSMTETRRKNRTFVKMRPVEIAGKLFNCIKLITPL